eukprot:2969401-Amphidinium_carterae.1
MQKLKTKLNKLHPSTSFLETIIRGNSFKEDDAKIEESTTCTLVAHDVRLSTLLPNHLQKNHSSLLANSQCHPGLLKEQVVHYRASASSPHTLGRQHLHD